MSTAIAQVPSSLTGSGARTAVVAQAGLALVTLAAAYFAAPVLGLALPGSALVLVGIGAVAVVALPERAIALSVATGIAALVWMRPGYAAYHVALVGTLFLARRRTWTLALTLALGALLVPKLLFWGFYARPAFYQWLHEPALAAAIFITVYWWREARDRRLPPQASGGAAPLAQWGALFLLPTHACYPIAFGPGDLWRGRRVEAGAVLRGVALFSAKAAALVALRAAFPDHGFSARPAHAVLALPLPQLWIVVALNYVELVLVLSGVADVAVVIARLYGWPLPSPFRWALLAWNPVELWRRWGIYTRRFLLKTVYFPLGGSTRHQLLNVMATFMASALVLHSGWLGSKYWQVGPGGWRDHSLYFLLQGVAVCACLVTWQVRGKQPSADRALRWSWGRVPATVATQAMSALLHVIILAQSLSFADRWRLIARCLGL